MGTDEQQEQVRELREEVSDLEKQLADLQAMRQQGKAERLAKKREDRRKARRELDKKLKKNREVELELDRLESETASAKGDVARLNEIREKVATNERELKQEEAELANLRKSKIESDQMEDEIEKLKQEVQAIEQLHSDSSLYDDALEKNFESIERLERENDVLSKTLARRKARRDAEEKLDNWVRSRTEAKQFNKYMDVSADALIEMTPDKEGWIVKRANNNHYWKRRYCVLVNNYLFYYKSKTNTRSKMSLRSSKAKFIRLINAKVAEVGRVVGRDAVFFLQTESGLKFYMVAETDQDMREWVRTIRQNVTAESFKARPSVVQTSDQLLRMRRDSMRAQGAGGRRGSHRGSGATSARRAGPSGLRG